MRAELKQQTDDSWIVEFSDLAASTADAIKAMLLLLNYEGNFPKFKAAKPVLQDELDNWILIEFQTENLDAIIDACEELQETLLITIENL